MYLFPILWLYCVYPSTRVYCPFPLTSDRGLRELFLHGLAAPARSQSVHRPPYPLIFSVCNFCERDTPPHLASLWARGRGLVRLRDTYLVAVWQLVREFALATRFTMKYRWPAPKPWNANLGIRRVGKPQDVFVCLQFF